VTAISSQSEAQAAEALRHAPHLVQRPPEDGSRPHNALVALPAASARGLNFGRFCNAMVHLPLAQASLRAAPRTAPL